MKNNSVVVGFPFVNHVNQDLRPTIENPIEFLKNVYSTPFYTNGNNILNTGFYKSLGYKYDFRPYLKSFVYKQHGCWFESYAPNKTLLRSITISKIEKIIEIK
jgi:hypothetical protein